MATFFGRIAISAPPDARCDRGRVETRATASEFLGATDRIAQLFSRALRRVGIPSIPTIAPWSAVGSILSGMSPASLVRGVQVAAQYSGARKMGDVISLTTDFGDTPRFWWGVGISSPFYVQRKRANGGPKAAPPPADSPS